VRIPHIATMLDVVWAVSEYATNDDEIIATVASLINSGTVRLCGTFAGARIDVSTPGGAFPLSSADLKALRTEK
jgi:hypothetical protein